MINEPDKRKFFQIAEPQLYEYSGGAREQGTASHYAPRAAYEVSIYEICDVLGVTRYQLSKLLGLGFPTQLYSWTSGRQRPSSKYCLRMIRLLLMHNSGYSLALLDSVNWQEGRALAGGIGQQQAQSKTAKPVYRRRRDQEGALGDGGRTALSND